MAASMSGAKLPILSALLLDTFSLSLSRRGYAAASQGAVLARSGAARMGKATKEDIERSVENSWVPDPVTGYYRPANRPMEIDVAELREMMTKQSMRSR